jgi:aspartyl-tRNA(Asn)/glutamyl-tRNA(Gln) amidotransferase subunit C
MAFLLPSLKRLIQLPKNASILAHFLTLDNYLSDAETISSQEHNRSSIRPKIERIMALNNADILKIAKLARLQVDDQQADDYANSITSILDLIDEMQAVNTDGIEPLSNPLDAHQRLRADEVTAINKRDEFMAIAPASEAGLFLVPKVIE